MQWLPHLVHPVGFFLSFPWKWSCQHPPLLSFMNLRTCFCWRALQCFLFFSARAELLIWQVSAPFQICLFSSLRIEYSLCLKRSFNLCFSSQKQLPNAKGAHTKYLTFSTCCFMHTLFLPYSVFSFMFANISVNHSTYFSIFLPKDTFYRLFKTT